MTDLFTSDETAVDDENQIASEIIKKPASVWLPEQYLPFTMYAIRSRALVSDDGLKPVNRRILYSLFKEGLTPNSEHLKAARAAANAVAYHPHGSSSVEDALARMAQNFSLRIPLIDPYGSVGFVTGDTPAAARYWECRLSKEAMELLKELPDGAVPIGKNFDGKLDEPGQLPVRWPNNIINGTQGIAVGYASNMFSHNPEEVMKAAIAVLKNPDLTVNRLLKIMPGPDLPTGGELFEVDGVKEYYETGSGRFVIRGRYQIEKMSKGKVRIIFYELPYQVSANSVILRIRKAQAAGKLKEIAVVKDLTDKKNGLRLAIETKAGTNYMSVLNELFRSTPVEAKFSVNNTVLIDGSPVQVPMVSLLKRFVDFRRECTLNKATTRISKIDSRIHQLSALLAALVDIDECIKIIRNSDTSDIAKKQLMKTFKIDSDQSEYILSMQLRRLTRADAVAIKKENDELLAERALMDQILTSKETLDAAVEKDLRDTLKVIADPRRTVISGMTSEALKEASKEVAQVARDVDKNVACYVTRFADGTILKSSEPFEYQKGTRKYHNSPMIEQIKAKTQDDIILVSKSGTGYRIPLNYVAPEIASSPSDCGVGIKDSELAAIARAVPLKTDIGLVLGTKLGEVKLVKPEFPDREEFAVFKLIDGDEIVGGRWLGRALGTSKFISISSSSNVLIYPASSVRPMGVAAGGVKSQRLKDGDEVVFFGWAAPSKDNEVLILSQSEATIKLTQMSDVPAKSKGAQGVVLHKFKKGETKLINAFAGSDVVLAMTELNNAITSPPVSRRAATGTDFKISSHFGSSTVAPM